MVITGRGGGWLPVGWPVKAVDLTPLTDEQTDELIVAPDSSLSAERRSAVLARCDGVPLDIEQLIRALGEKSADDLAETWVPEALYEPLFARLHDGANLVPVVEAAAIIGRHVDHSLLCSVADVSEDEVDDVIDKLEDALVLEPWGTNSWRFRHELLREVAAEVAPPSVRRGLHAKVADAPVHGAGGGDPDWGLVAGHYEQAQRFDAAASASHRSGRPHPHQQHLARTRAGARLHFSEATRDR